MSESDSLEKWATAALRIHSQDLTTEKISALLGRQPTRAFAKGERMSPRNPSSAVFGEHLWILESGETTLTPIENHIATLVTFIEEKLSFLTALAETCEMDIFCGYSPSGEQGGFTLDGKILTALTAIPLDLVFDINCSTK